MTSRSQRTSSFVFLVALFCFALTSCSVDAETITWQDIKQTKGLSELSRAQFFESYKSQALRNIKKRSLRDFALGFVSFRTKQFRAAIVSFVKASSTSKSYTGNYTSNQVLPYIKKLQSKSALYNEALFYVALSYAKLHHVKDPLRVLTLIEKSSASPLVEMILNLKASLLSSINIDDAIKTYKSLLKANATVTYLLRLNALLKKKKNTSIERFHALQKALYFHKVSWAKKSVAREFLHLLKNHPPFYKNLSLIEKIYYHEGLRLLRKRKAINKFWSSVKIDGRIFRDMNATIYYIKYLFTHKRYQAIKSALRRANQHLSKENAGIVAAETSFLLVNGKLYSKCLEYLWPFRYNEKTAKQILISAHKIHSNKIVSMATYYLNNINRNDRWAENAYFHVCYSYYTQKKYNLAKKCLQSLAQLTQNVATGGRSRYYLGRIYQKQKQPKKANNSFQAAYLNSPESSYAFKALKQVSYSSKKNIPLGVEEQRKWIAGTRLNATLIAKFNAKKKEILNFAVAPIWQKWQSTLNTSFSNAKLNIMKAAFFQAIGFSSASSKYVKSSGELASNEKKYIFYQKLGMLIADTHLKYHYLKRYITLKKIEVDVFFMSSQAQEFYYPRPYYQKVTHEANKYNLEVAGIYALMRQESQYHTHATSSSNAKGLLQVLTSTARYVNRRLKIANMNLYNPNHNLEIGIKFYSDVYKQFHGNFEKVATAYNGGPNRLWRWLKNIAFDNIEDFYEKIPRNETYFYTKITKGNFDRYLYLESVR